MDLYQFYQLFKRHLLLLILVPIVLAVSVYLFTRDQPRSYSSSAVIYTGIATGYSIETTDKGYLDYYGTNVQFDNLINLFNSRQIIEQTAIRLLAQDLSLQQPNPQYISAENWNALQRLVPKKVKNLVVKNGKMGMEREKEEQIRSMKNRIKSLEREIILKNNNSDTRKETGLPEDDRQAENYADIHYHTVKEGENLSAIAAQYGLSMAEIIEVNDLNSQRLYSGQILMVEKPETGGRQYHTVKPGETLFSIARRYNISLTRLRELNRLSASELQPGQNLLISSRGQDQTALNNQAYIDKQANQEYVSYLEDQLAVLHMNDDGLVKDPIVPPGVSPSDFRATIENFTAYYHSSDTNFIYELLHYAHRHYSIGAINQKSNVTRIGSSDLIEMTYQSDDPGICQQTLKILSDVFIKNYKELRINQTDAVVAYFQEQVDSANTKLQRAEDRRLKFNRDNSIINYDEQSKAIANQKEDLDLLYQNEQIRLASAAAAIEEIETKLASKDSIYLSTDEMQKAREKLQKIEELIFINQLDAENDPRIGDKLDKLKLEAAALKARIKQLVDRYYMFSHSPQGMPVKELLTEWLQNVIAFEEAKAALQVLRGRKNDFRSRYEVMAPLGAMLKRIEREIEVAEQSYLEMLRNLNQAKMKQQNLQMATNIKIVDEPYFPITANSSMTKLLVLVAAVIGFIIVAFIIIVLEYFDSSIKSPERVEKTTKLKLAGAYPRFSSARPSEEFKNLAERLLEIIIQNIKLAISRNTVYQSRKPYLILVFSTRPDAGKTTLASNLIGKMREYGENVLFLNYTKANSENESDNQDHEIYYKIDNKFVDITHIKELLTAKYIRKENIEYDYIFLEIPSIIHHSFPLELIETVDLSLLVLRAKDYWKKADISAMDALLEVSREKPMAILNMAEVHALEDIVNTVPKQNGSLGKRIREIITYPARIKVRVRVD